MHGQQNIKKIIYNVFDNVFTVNCYSRKFRMRGSFGMELIFFNMPRELAHILWLNTV